MRKIYRYQLENNLKYFRKIHIHSDVWLVSLYAKYAQDGKSPFNFHNVIVFPLSFVFIPVKVKD